MGQAPIRLFLLCFLGTHGRTAVRPGAVLGPRLPGPGWGQELILRRKEPGGFNMSLWLQPGLCSSWSCGESQEMISNQGNRTMLPLLTWELSEQPLCPTCVGVFLSFNTIGRYEDGPSVEAASAVFPYKAGLSSLLEKHCHNLTQDSGIAVLVTVQPVALSIHGFALASSLLI